MKNSFINQNYSATKGLQLLCIILMLAAIISIFPSSLVAQADKGWKASPEIVSKKSANPQGINYEEEKVPPYTLPSLLTSSKGLKITNKIDWIEIRRLEILELFTSQVYGRVPSTLYEKTIKIIKEDKNAMGGSATLKLVDITITAGEKSITIHMGLFIPNLAPKPVPAFLLICNRSIDNIDFTREKKSEFWPAEEAIARGYAMAAFFNGDVDPDKHDDFKNGIHGVLDDSRSGDSWGTLAAWAWGASRCMDYLVTDKAIDPKKVAVIGHSRGGKTSLWAGVVDERFALSIGNDAGCGGSSLSMRIFGETVEKINTAFPHWFCENFKVYNKMEHLLPVDQHMLMALIAPRAVYVASADEDLWADPRGEYLALYHSLPAFNLYGLKMTLSEYMPPLNTPVYSGKAAYHIRDGVHNLLLKDWNFFMDYADVLFKKK